MRKPSGFFDEAIAETSDPRAWKRVEDTSHRRRPVDWLRTKRVPNLVQILKLAGVLDSAVPQCRCDCLLDALGDHDEVVAANDGVFDLTPLATNRSRKMVKIRDAPTLQPFSDIVKYLDPDNLTNVRAVADSIGS